MSAGESAHQTGKSAGVIAVLENRYARLDARAFEQVGDVIDDVREGEVRVGALRYIVQNYLLIGQGVESHQDGIGNAGLPRVGQ